MDQAQSQVRVQEDGGRRRERREAGQSWRRWCSDDGRDGTAKDVTEHTTAGADGGGSSSSGGSSGDFDRKEGCREPCSDKLTIR